jgi:hypothetical protein
VIQQHLLQQLELAKHLKRNFIAPGPCKLLPLLQKYKSQKSNQLLTKDKD